MAKNTLLMFLKSQSLENEEQSRFQIIHKGL